MIAALVELNANDRLGGIDIDRPCVHHHLMRSRRFAQQFATANPNVATQHRITIFRHPDDVVLAIPDRMAAPLLRFHPANLRRKRRHPAA
jgi:hypothetical protein